MSRPAVTVPTPWYPTPFQHMAGSFVAEHARLLTRLADSVHVVHAQEWPGGDAAAHARIGPDMDAVLDRLAGGGATITGAAGPVTRVPVFTVGGTTIPQRGEAMVAAVRRVTGPFETPVVHGHVGYWGGLLAARLADPAAAVFATEHSTGLRAVLEDPQGRDHYAELCERARKVFCVSGLLRDQVLAALPQYADVVEVMPNPVTFRGVPRREKTPEALRQWVFVGALSERKGVERLVRAFCAVARDDAEVQLTMFGDGDLADRLRALAAEAGVGERLHLRGVVGHGQVLRELPAFDLLLAPSTYETFHLAVVEAVAAGLPVIVTRSGGPQEALAGVEHLVGRFVDVDDDPAGLVDAYRELGAALDTLDLDAARETLDARYGPDAIAARLAAAYGVDQAAVQPFPVRAAGPVVVDPREVVVLAGSGWRRYAITPELAACRALGAATTVVTSDAAVTKEAAGLRLLRPEGIALGSAVGPSPGAAPPAAGEPELPLAVKARRLAGRVRRQLQGKPVALPPKDLRVPVGDLAEATLLVADCQAMPLARQILDAAPRMRVVVELDRGGALAPPPDVPEESP